MAPFTITRSTLDEEFTFTGSFDITGLLDACQNPASFQKRSPKLDNIPLHFSLKKEEGGDSLKVFLHDPSRSSELYDCEVTLRAWDGSVVESLSFFSKSIREGSGRGWSSFCKISALQDFLASNDLAKIQYKITCYGHGDTTIPRPLHGIQATQRLTNLTASIFDNKDSSDALFVIKPPETAAQVIHVHSSILIEASPYFKKLIDSARRSSLQACTPIPVDAMQHPRATPRAGPGRNSVITPDEGQSASDAASSVTNGSFKESASNKIVFKICDPDPSYETYETFRAVLFYLYTGFIAFTSLGSAHAETGAGSEATVDMDDDRVAMYWNFAEYKNALRYSKFCGDPRSIYELADLWEIPGLKRAAASHIERNLTPANIVTGLFSDFTGRHPELQGFHIERAIEYWDDIATTPAMKEVLQSPNPQTVEIMLRLFAGLRKEKR